MADAGRTRAAEGNNRRQFFAPEIGWTPFQVSRKMATLLLSSWLCFLKNRLDLAKLLLAENGAIFVQIGDKNEARVRLLLDDAFGEDNFINKITIRTRSPSGFKTVNLGVFETAEYIYIYGKNKAKWKYTPQFVATDYDTNYSIVVTNKYDHHDSWICRNIEDVVSAAAGFPSKQQAKIELGDYGLLQKCAEYALNNAESVCQSTAIGDDAGQETLTIKVASLARPDRVFCVSRSNHADRYVLNGRELAFYAKKVRVIDGKKTPTTMLTNIWTDISWEGIAKEGSVTLKKGKKLERLVRRIIDMSSESGDLVLDFFAGSGTTLAVAHKMGRRWIGIEQMDYIDTITQARLKKVLEGEQGGISKAVEWQGGGEFVSVELAKWNGALLDEIHAATDAAALGVLLEKLQTLPWSAFVNYTASPAFLFDSAQTDAQGRRFADLPLPEQKQLLVALLDKNFLYANLADLDARKWHSTKPPAASTAVSTPAVCSNPQGRP